ncbi:MAG: hypothetical protein Q9165_006098 [Trypethelium subeluteriae]
MKTKTQKTREEAQLANVENSKVDLALASLFASSAGPVQRPQKSRLYGDSAQTLAHAPQEFEKTINNGATNAKSDFPLASPKPEENALASHSRRKRKSRSQQEEIEDTYLRRLSQDAKSNELDRDNSQPRKRLRSEKSMNTSSTNDGQAGDAKTPERKSSSSADEDGGDASEGMESGEDQRPIHESLMPNQADSEIEKASRTVFLGNVSNSAITSKSARRDLMTHISAVLQSPSLPEGTHKVQSLRFRSTAYTSSVPKKGAFARKDLMDATTKSTNAYVVYTSQSAAREAAKTLNGTVVLDRHLRADLVAHPAKVDHRRCVFVGNLGFVDDESSSKTADSDDEDERGKRKKSKSSGPGDVEEGLWREFGKVGVVESVRVVRDAKTRVGKGFAYVQFIDENAVEEALLYEGKKFPPLLPRKLRVSRAKSIKRNAAVKLKSPPGSLMNGNGRKLPGDRNSKLDSQQQSLVGRAGKMLGKAGAAAMSGRSSRSRAGQSRGSTTQLQTNGDTSSQIRSPENFVFEGHRASSHQRPSGLKLAGRGKSKSKGQKPGRPKTRSANRAAAWKTKESKRP